MNPDTTPVEVPRVIVRDNKVPPKLGGMVLYVLSERDTPTAMGQFRPAIIVDFDHEANVILAVFTNGGPDQLQPLHRVVGAVHDEDGKGHGTWHWPPPRELVFSVQAEQPKTSEEILTSFGLAKPVEVPTGAEHSSLADPFPVPFKVTEHEDGDTGGYRG